MLESDAALRPWSSLRARATRPTRDITTIRPMAARARKDIRP
jgi:hypothetical protein